MPHLFTNRKRKHSLDVKKTEQHQFHWEVVNAVVYLVGGGMFIVGSVLFLPKYEAYSNTGVVIFVVGSFLYLLVTPHDLLELLTYRKSTDAALIKLHFLELAAASIYVFGTLLFVMGSVFFLNTVEMTAAGSYCFIFGSVLFFLGACINAVQIVQSPNLSVLQLMNATAISFAVGSTIFVFGSIPYLFHLNKSDQTVVFTLVGWAFIIGSVFFLVGGIFNLFRATVCWND